MPKIIAVEGTLYEISKLLVKLTPSDKTEKLAEPAHQFAALIHKQAIKAGLNTMELCCATLELLDTYMPKEYNDVIARLEIVALGGVITFDKNKEDTDTASITEPIDRKKVN